MDAWLSYVERVGNLDSALYRHIPDFMVIGPPKTGTSWLFAQLSRHPGIFMPAGKELRYFDLGWRYGDVNAYVRRFETEDYRLKGEASPTYCLLPCVAIAAIARLNPGMRVIILARDPVAQAWSLMRHNFRHKEANFCFVIIIIIR